MNRKEYEEDLKRRQKEHLKKLYDTSNWQPCLHDSCPECIGTGVDRFGRHCVHWISCPCPKCSPQMISGVL